MKQLLVFLFLLCSTSVFAQDVIVKKDGSTIVCRVMELTSTEIIYKKWSDLNGSNYVMNRTDASTINYQNGKKIKLSESNNLYKPNNQNDGVQQYNDRALLALDYANQKTDRQIKNLKKWGLISGFAGVGLGIGHILLCFDSDSKIGEDVAFCIGGAVLAAGCVATSAYCFITSHKKQKQAEMYLHSSTLYKYDFKFTKGSSLSAGIDILSDRALDSNTLALGLHYNF